MKKVILRAQDVCKKFPGSLAGESVLNKISLDVYAGDFTVIMGVSGSGKSTLLHALSGMDGISSGEVIFQDQKLSTLKEKQKARLLSREFGFVFQKSHLVSNLTLYENILVAGYSAKKKSRQQTQIRVQKLLEQMNVTNAANRLPAQVSGGEAQRAAIARAVIHEPTLIFADEPTGSLNKGNSDEIMNLFGALNDSGQSILMVTHDVRAARRANRILYLEDGRIIDELKLGRYDESELPKREIQISTWLSKMQW